MFSPPRPAVPARCRAVASYAVERRAPGTPRPCRRPAGTSASRSGRTVRRGSSDPPRTADGRPAAGASAVRSGSPSGATHPRNRRPAVPRPARHTGIRRSRSPRPPLRPRSLSAESACPLRTGTAGTPEPSGEDRTAGTCPFPLTSGRITGVGCLRRRHTFASVRSHLAVASGSGRALFVFPAMAKGVIVMRLPASHFSRFTTRAHPPVRAPVGMPFPRPARRRSLSSPHTRSTGMPSHLR